MFVEKAFCSGILRDAYHQLEWEESKHSSVGSLLWTFAHGVDHLFLLGSLVLILASFGRCMDLIAWRKGNEKVIVATMFLIAHFMVNFCAIGLPIIPGDFCNFFGLIPIFPASAIIATWVFFSGDLSPISNAGKLAGNRPYSLHSLSRRLYSVSYVSLRSVEPYKS